MSFRTLQPTGLSHFRTEYLPRVGGFHLCRQNSHGDTLLLSPQSDPTLSYPILVMGYPDTDPETQLAEWDQSPHVLS